MQEGRMGWASMLRKAIRGASLPAPCGFSRLEVGSLRSDHKGQEPPAPSGPVLSAMIGATCSPCRCTPLSAAGTRSPHNESKPDWSAIRVTPAADGVAAMPTVTMPSPAARLS